MNFSVDFTRIALALIPRIFSMKQNNQLNVRLSEDLRKKLGEACDITGLDAATVVRACVQAFVDQVESTGEIRLPLSIIPKSELPKSEASSYTGGRAGHAPQNPEHTGSTPLFSVNEEPEVYGTPSKQPSKKSPRK